MGLEPHAGQRDPHRRRDRSSRTERLEPLGSRVSRWPRQQGRFGHNPDSYDADPESPAVSLWHSSSGRRGCSHRQSCHGRDTQASPGSVHRSLARPGWGRGHSVAARLRCTETARSDCCVPHSRAVARGTQAGRARGQEPPDAAERSASRALSTQCGPRPAPLPWPSRGLSPGHTPPRAQTRSHARLRCSSTSAALLAHSADLWRLTRAETRAVKERGASAKRDCSSQNPEPPGGFNPFSKSKTLHALALRRNFQTLGS